MSGRSSRRPPVLERCRAGRMPSERRARRGFTLVELMVGLAVGLFVSVIAISLFVSTRKLQVVNSASNRLSENARLAFDLLQRDLRLAGFRGCSNGVAEPSSVLNLAAGGGDFLIGANGVRGYRGNGSGFSPTLPAALQTVPKAPLNSSDIVSVRVPVDALSFGLMTSMAGVDAAPDVGTSTGGNDAIDAGDIVLMSNCKTAVLFQVTGLAGAPAATGLLPHDAGVGSPGNAVATLNTRYNAADTAVYRVQTRHYYVAESARRAGSYALWRLTVPAPAAGPAAEEVVAGIERLSIVYGLEIDAAADRAVDRYASADGVTDWNDVLSARIQMLTTTVDNGTARAASSVQFAGSAVLPGDRRLREVFTEVVAFRNLMP